VAVPSKSVRLRIRHEGCGKGTPSEIHPFFAGNTVGVHPPSGASALAELAALPESFHREAIKLLLAKVHKEIESGTVYCCARDTNAVKEILGKEVAYKGYKLGNAVDIEGGIIVESTDSELQIDYRV
jgi:hypothetical protein